jgi:transmembrane sensor
MSRTDVAAPAAVERCAAEWILRRDRGDLTAEERARLEVWLSEDSRHREAYLKLLELWRFSAALKAWRPAHGQVDTRVLDGTMRRPDLAHRSWPLAIAAAIILLVVAASAVFLRQRQGVFTTQVGGYQRLLLEDGSVLQLNTNSKVRVRLSDTRREVSLLQGEAYFDVARDAHRPFDVVAGETVVRALGTAFSVRLREPTRVDVVVTQGRVAIKEAGSSKSILTAGEIAEAQPASVRSQKVQPAELTRRMAWQTGMLYFKDKPMAEVVAEFNRYNHRQIQIADSETAALEVGGSFKANDLPSFLAAIHGVRDISIEDSGERIVLSRQSP